jgi:hypothetical protein
MRGFKRGRRVANKGSARPACAAQYAVCPMNWAERWKINRGEARLIGRAKPCMPVERSLSVGHIIQDMDCDIH